MFNTHTYLSALVSCLLAILSSDALAVDVVHYKTGTVVKGRIVAQDSESVTLETPGGFQARIKRHEVASIERNVSENQQEAKQVAATATPQRTRRMLDMVDGWATTWRNIQDITLALRLREAVGLSQVTCGAHLAITQSGGGIFEARGRLPGYNEKPTRYEVLLAVDDQWVYLKVQLMDTALKAKVSRAHVQESPTRTKAPLAYGFFAYFAPGLDMHQALKSLPDSSRFTVSDGPLVSGRETWLVAGPIWPALGQLLPSGLIPADEARHRYGGESGLEAVSQVLVALGRLHALPKEIRLASSTGRTIARLGVENIRVNRGLQIGDIVPADRFIDYQDYTDYLDTFEENLKTVCSVPAISARSQRQAQVIRLKSPGAGDGFSGPMLRLGND